MSDSAIPLEYRLSSYTYELPPERIAQSPAERRDASRLLVVDRTGGDRVEAAFTDLTSLLPKGALLVANNSKVIPARVFGAKPTGGRVEMLLLTPPPLLSPKTTRNGQAAEATCLLRSSKPARPGDVLRFGPDFSVKVLERGDYGRSRVELRWSGELADLLRAQGHMPLPPYITRPDTEADQLRYQTTYARDDKAGSAAAPTAGLHFTPQLRDILLEKGFSWAEVTLYVGYGTFSPVRAKDIRDHRMHSEYIEVSAETAEAVARAKDEGRPVVAVGTTSARTLEGMWAALGRVGEYAGETDIYLMPGARFNVVDCLLTNFHLPESSLLIMVSALAGRKNILAAYADALERKFRFFSYGDAMLIR